MTSMFRRPLARECGLAYAGFVGRFRLAIAAAVFVAAAHAQRVAGVVRGSIADQRGRHVAEVKVTLTNRETGVERGAASDSRGEFTIASVPPGEYRLEAQRQGFLKYGQTLTMEVGEEIRVELGLATEPADTIEVTGIAPLVHVESSVTGGVIDNRQILGLPLDGRNFYQFSRASNAQSPTFRTLSSTKPMDTR